MGRTFQMAITTAAGLVVACGGSDFEAERLDVFDAVPPPEAFSVAPEAPRPPVGVVAPRDLPSEWTSEVCPTGSVKFAFEDACRPIGTPCAAFAPDLPPDTVYVDPSAAAGGDGSRGAPLRSLDDAIAQAPDHGTIALTNRIFLGNLRRLDRPVRVVGACVAETSVSGFLVGAEGVVLENLRLIQVGIETTASATIAAAGIGGGNGLGVIGVGGRLHLTDVEISNVRTASTSSITGGLVVGAGHRLTGHNVVIRATRNTGLQALGSTTTVDLDGVAILETGGFQGRQGVGVLAHDGARVNLSSLAIATNRESAVRIETGARVTIADALMADTLGSFESTPMVHVTGGGALDLRRARLARAPSHGIEALNGAAVVLEDVVISDIRSEEDLALGAGVGVYGGAKATLRRVEVRGAEAHPEFGRTGEGLRLEGAASRLDVEDLFVADVGIGVEAEDGELFVRRCRIEGAEYRMVFVDGVRGRFEDLDLFDGRGSRGLEVRFSEVEVERFRADSVREFSLYTIGSALFVRDVEVLRPRPNDLGDGVGIVMLNETSMDARRVRIEGALGAGIIGLGLEGELAAATARLRDVVVRGTREGNSSSIGVAAITGFDLDLDTFLVEDNAIAGVHIADRSTLRARQGLIVKHAIGMNIFDEDFDPTGVESTVRYRDNARNLQALRIQLDLSGLE